jgi:O-antigen/teichoic acid export membrane protein
MFSAWRVTLAKQMGNFSRRITSFKRSDSYFSTGYLDGDLKGLTVRGSAFTITAQGLMFLIRIGSTAALARLLIPADFGLITMVLVVTGFAEMLKDGGLSMATVQRKDITHEQVSTLFWINVTLSTGLGLLISALSPLIARFYGEPRLTAITLVVAVSFLFSGLTIQHQALLRRQMRFGTVAIIDVASLAVSVITGILMAIYGFGFWSLVAMQVSGPMANVVLVWTLCGWRPKRPRRGTKVRSMLAFGGNLTASSFLRYWTRKLADLLIGVLLGASQLGLYGKAYQLLMMPIDQINSPVSAAALPALSRLQDAPERFRQFYLKGVSYLTFVGMPIVAFAFVAADEIVAIFLGPGWEGAAPIFRILAPAAFIGTINVADGWVFLPLGRADKEVKSSLFSSVVSISALLIGIRWGVFGIAASLSCGEVVKKIPQLLYAYSGSPIRLGHLLKAIWKQMTASLLSLGLSSLILPYLKQNLVTNFIILFLLFTAMYLSIFSLMPGSIGFIKELFTDLEQILKRKKLRRSNESTKAGHAI